MDVAAGGNVEVVLGDFLTGDDARILLLFLPRSEGVGYADNGVSGDVVLRVALAELAARVEQEEFALPLLRLCLVQHDNDAGGAGVVEEVFRQIEHALDQVLLHEPAAYVLFLVGVRVAGAARGCAGVVHYGGAAFVIQAGENVLHPAPVRLASGKAGVLGKAVELVGVVVLFLELGLVPHGIGHHPVEGPEAVARAELGLAEGVADLDLSLHVVDDHVHVRHGPGAGLILLPIEPRGGEGLAGAKIHLLLEHQFTLNKQAGGTAAGVIDVHAWFGIHDAGYYESDLGRCIELARAFAAVLRKLADEVFVAAADDVRLNIGKAEALGADLLDQVGEAVVVEISLTVGRGIEVYAVDNTFEQRVGVGDGAEMSGELLAYLLRQRANNGPDRVVGVLRLKREVEPHELLVVLHQLERLGSRADLLGYAVQLVVENIAQALGEDKRKDKLLVLRRVLCPANGAGRVPDPGFEGLAVGLDKTAFAGAISCRWCRPGFPYCGFWRRLFLCLLRSCHPAPVLSRFVLMPLTCERHERIKCTVKTTKFGYE